MSKPIAIEPTHYPIKPICSFEFTRLAPKNSDLDEHLKRLFSKRGSKNKYQRVGRWFIFRLNSGGSLDDVCRKSGSKTSGLKFEIGQTAVTTFTIACSEQQRTLAKHWSFVPPKGMWLWIHRNGASGEREREREEESAANIVRLANNIRKLLATKENNLRLWIAFCVENVIQ